MSKITTQQAQQLGQWAEQQAKQILEQAGFHILAQNFHSRYGEIDLIALQQELIVLVEVKARRGQGWGESQEFVTLSKQRKLIKTALYFMQQQPNLAHFYYRFDVICFDFKQQFAKTLQQTFCDLAYDQQWIENAFTIDVELINL